MSIDSFTLHLLILFLPGIIVTYIIDLFTTHKKKTSFFFIVSSFVFGIITYLIYDAIYGILSLWFDKLTSNRYTIETIQNSNMVISTREIFFASIIAVFLGTIISKVINNKILFRFAHYLGITNKFEDDDVWGYILNSKVTDDTWVYIRDIKTNFTYAGLVVAFSENSKDAEILLSNVSVYNSDNSDFLYELELLYLAKEREDIILEFPHLNTVNDKEELKNDN